MTPDFIPYARQSIDDDDVQNVLAAIQSPYLTTGPRVKEFESQLADYVQAQYAVSFSSGTAALHAAYVVAGIGPGDEVLVPALSFVATANAVIYAGGRPVFVDSTADGFNLDLNDAKRKITSRTRAMAVVHFAGEPVNMTAVQEFAKKYNLKVVEDAAHALGATWQDRKIGALSDLTVFSFHAVKLITTAEGGMVTTNDPALAQALRRFRHHGIDIDVVNRDAAQSWHYDMISLGYNYRLSDVHCALGISQLRKVETFLQRRKDIAASYGKAFSRHSILTLPPIPEPGSRHAWHLYIVRINTKELGLSRDDVFSRLRAQKIGVHVHYRPIHLHTYYQRLGYKKGDCPIIEQTFEKMLTLPLFPAMTDQDVERVVSGVMDTVTLVA